MKSLLNTEFQDKRNLALEKLMQEIFNIDIKKFMIYPIENANDEVLEILSKEYHIQGFEGWNLAKTREEKQKLIANSFAMHAKRGTETSINTALKNLGADCEIKETNRPSHFGVKLNIFGNVNKADIRALIENYKPATRILDLIEYFLTTNGNMYIGGRIKILETVAIGTKEVIEQ